jgi:hypothetical protein
MDCTKCSKPIEEQAKCACDPTVCCACCACGDNCEGCECASCDCKEKKEEV